MHHDLHHFIKSALEKHKSKAEIQTILLKAGWQKDEIQASLNHYLESDFPIAVPVRQPYLSAKEAFYYLVTFFTLYVTAWNLGMLFFGLINIGFPDPVLGSPYEISSGRDQIRIATSSLLVAFPIFIFMTNLVERAQRKNANLKNSKIRKWLTYITLFIAAGIIIGNLITVVYFLLDDGLTARFLLKALTILVIAGGMFGYYLWELKQEEK